MSRRGESLLVALTGMGVGPDATRVYQQLVRAAPLTRDEIAGATGLGPLVVDRACEELLGTGLAGVVEDDGGRWVPVSPSLGLDALTRKRAAEVDEARSRIVAAYEAFRRTRPHGEELGIEAVTGQGVGRRLQQLWRSAEITIEQFDSPPYVEIDGATDDALETLARGVAQRVVYTHASFLDERYFRDAIQPAVRNGELVRVIDEVPLKLILVDRRVAMVSAAADDAERHHTTLVVTNDVLLRALGQLFDRVWEASLPLGEAPQGTGRRLPALDQQLLSLLAIGLQDDDVARQLGISRRTLSRRLEPLMTRTGSTTRFQLALQARRRGWI